MNKEKLKTYTYRVEVEIAGDIINAVLNREPRAVVMSKVKKRIMGLQLFSDLNKNQLWLWATSFYRHCIAGAARQTDLDKRAESLYAVLRNDVSVLEHTKNAIADRVEFDSKHTELMQILRDDQNKFFYCTAHKNCAEGHQAYQGRLYFRQSGTFSEEEQDFINKNKLLSVEEVVMEPIWLTTRRNCKHRLIPISYSRLKTGDYSEFRVRHEISYEEGQYNAYKDRYRMYSMVKKTFEKSDVKIPKQLAIDQKRTKQLVRAWKERKEKGGS